MKNKGVLYIAFGEKYVDEAIYSAKSLKRHCPELPAALFTDKKIEDSVFDNIKIIEADHIRCKVDYIYDSPYDYTLYLDSDTKINHDITEMFEILDKFDIALTHSFARKLDWKSKAITEYAEIPYSFPECEGGVILFKKSEKTKHFFKLWRGLFYKYKEQTKNWDQATFRVALWQSDLKIHTLPIEYNLRSQGNREKIDRLMESGNNPDLLKPKILHWHGLSDSENKNKAYKL